jgi:hypothetical protein
MSSKCPNLTFPTFGHFVLTHRHRGDRRKCSSGQYGSTNCTSLTNRKSPTGGVVGPHHQRIVTAKILSSLITFFYRLPPRGKSRSLDFSSSPGAIRNRGPPNAGPAPHRFGPLREHASEETIFVQENCDAEGRCWSLCVSVSGPPEDTVRSARDSINSQSNWAMSCRRWW